MTPQQKKLLSYKRDRRNIYSANHGASIKGIRKGKRRIAKAGRRASHQLLGSVRDPEDAVVDTVADLSFHAPATWRKLPDQPLGRVLTQHFSRKLEDALFHHAASIPSFIPEFIKVLPEEEFTLADCRYIARSCAADYGRYGRPQLNLSLRQTRSALRVARMLLSRDGIEPLAKRAE